MKSGLHGALLVIATIALFSYAQSQENTRVMVPTIKKVDWVEEEIDPPNLLLTVDGEVPTGGYKDVALVRAIYVAPPADGIQDYFIMATKPTGIVTQVVTPVQAKDKWKGYKKEAPWIKGVRVHGIDKGVMVKIFDESKKK